MTTYSDPPPAGHVYIDFDAGGSNTCVDCNPQFPVWDKAETSFTITWKIRKRLNVAPDYGVRISNVVPADPGHLPEGYKLDSRPTLDGWMWEFKPEIQAPPKIQSGAIEYGLYLIYQDNSSIPILPPGSRFVVTSAGKPMAVDPTLRLPPKKGDGTWPKPGK